MIKKITILINIFLSILYLAYYFVNQTYPMITCIYHIFYIFNNYQHKNKPKTCCPGFIYFKAFLRMQPPAVSYIEVKNNKNFKQIQHFKCNIKLMPNFILCSNIIVRISLYRSFLCIAIIGDLLSLSEINRKS